MSSFESKEKLLDNSSPLCFLAITTAASPVKTREFILLFSTTCFGLKGHHQFEHKSEGIYVHNVYGLEISELHSWGCYVAKRNMGRTALGNRTVLKNNRPGIYKYEHK